MENKMEGGPACDYFWHNKAGKDVVCLEVDRKENHRDDCPGCKGTGVKPLSEWTADECAEWLKKYHPIVFRGALLRMVEAIDKEEKLVPLDEFLRAAVEAAGVSNA